MSMVEKKPARKQLTEKEGISLQARKILTSCMIGLGALVTAASLISFQHSDYSFIYETTAIQSTQNWLGFVGAYWASLLLYFFGMSAWILPVLLFYILRVQLFNLAWKREFDRCAALLILMFIATGITHEYSLDWYRGVFPGGLCGRLISELLQFFFSGLHKELLYFMLTWATLIVIARFSFILYLYPVLDALKRIPFREIFGRIRATMIQPFTQKEKDDESLTTETNSQFERLYKELKEPESEGELSHPLVAATKVRAPKTSTSDEVLLPLTGNGGYHLPSPDLFTTVKETEEDTTQRTKSEERARALEEKLERFGIKGKIVAITQGPVVTLFEYQPSIDTRISTIVAREDDLALALQALSLRIIAPIPGRSVVGFEVAHSNRKPVLFSQILKSKVYTSSKALLPLILGKDTLGENVVIDLAAMPHLLVAGSTGSGKSVGLHTMITSLLCCRTPDEIKFILIDPKRLEFSAYADIAHLIFPIVTDPRRAIVVLKWAVETMEDRYEIMSQAGVRNAADFNKKYSPTDEEYMPLLVIVIDELADLMMTAGKDVEYLIARLAQMARAAGIHLIAATQRPSVDVITGLIKVNFPSRIAYKVTSKVDSRTILDMMGAEKLLGKGDMLFLDTKGGVQRIHGAYLTEAEITGVISHIKSQRTVAYHELTTQRKQENSEESDTILEEVLEYIKNKDEISISLLQRVFRVGYNRSARIIDQLEAGGYILPADGSKMRKVTKEL